MGRKLERGNPTAGNLGSDFGRLGLDFWTAVNDRNSKNPERQRKLGKLLVWRNAIAHQDFDAAKLDPPPPLRLQTVKGWRAACNALAKEFDTVLRAHLTILVGQPPW